MKMKIELTFSELMELSMVADNGYADGDYYHGGSKINHNAFLRAQSKLIKAIRDSHHKEDNNEQ